MTHGAPSTLAHCPEGYTAGPVPAAHRRRRLQIDPALGEQPLGAHVVEDEPVYRRGTRPVGIGEPVQLLDFRGWLELAAVRRRETHHAHDDALCMPVRLRLEHPGTACPAGIDVHRELFADLTRQGFDIRLPWFTLAAGDVPDTLAARTGHEHAVFVQMNPGNLVDDAQVQPSRFSARSRTRRARATPERNLSAAITRWPPRVAARCDAGARL